MTTTNPDNLARLGTAFCEACEGTVEPAPAAQPVFDTETPEP